MKRGLLLSSLLLASCTISQQQQHNRAMEETIRFNTAHIDKLRAEKIEQNRTLFSEYQKQIALATKAAWVRERGDCCCTGAELDPISPTPLSQKEFASVMKLLAKARPEPAPTRESIEPEMLASVIWDEDTGWKTHIEILPPPVIIPWNNLMIDKLQLMDANGEALLSICFDRTRGEKDKVENYIYTSWGSIASHWRYLWVELPGDTYAQFQNHPARLRFKKKVDAADKD